MGCGCRTTSAEALRAIGGGPPKASGGLAIDRPALVRALGGRDEVVEALEAKATGRPGVNVARIWTYMTTAVYTSGDLPVLATREALQNGKDAISAAIRARKLRAGEGRFSVTWDPERRALTWEDNGIAMDAETILTKFLSLGDSGKADASDSGEAAGGFGVAKAVILGTSPTYAKPVLMRSSGEEGVLHRAHFTNPGPHKSRRGGRGPRGQRPPAAQRGSSSDAMSASGALNRPRRSAGGTTASTASSFSVGSMRR